VARAHAVGEKRRKVGGPVDPERKRWDGMPLMVKIGGVRWEEVIGGVEVALREAGIVSCEGTRSSAKIIPCVRCIRCI